MARGAIRTGRSVGPVSEQLEEFFPINFDVIGTREWIEGCFEPGTMTEEQKIIVSSSGDLAESKEWLDKRPVHTVDTETSGDLQRDKYDGLNPLSPTSKIVMAQIGTPDRALLIEPQLIPEYKEHLESTHFLHVLQNAVFDFKFLLKKYGIHMRRMYDTMVGEQLLTSGIPGVGVGMPDITRKYYPHRLITKELRKQFMDFKGVFSRKATIYAARDIVVLEPVMTEQCKLFKQFKMEMVAQDEFDVIPCTAMMEVGGVPIDVRTLRLAISWWQKRERELVEKIMKMYDELVNNQGEKALFLLPEMREVFDVKSSSQKLEALSKIGIELDDTKRDTLEAIDHPLTRLLVEYSEVAKVCSTYGENLIARVDPRTGRLYPEFNQLGSGDLESRSGRVKKSTIATGRYSSDFQQLPRSEPRYEKVLDTAEIKRVREAFSEEILDAMEGVTA
jgi:DNA polymerase-1